MSVSAPGGHLASPSDEISIAVGKVIARPELLTINEDTRQVECRFLLKRPARVAVREERHGRIVYQPPPDWGEEFADAILGKLLEEAHGMDREDLFLYALIMNELPRHCPEGFPFGPGTIRRARAKAGTSSLYRVEYLVNLHHRLHRLVRIAVYTPSDVYISGRYFKGTPFQGGSLIHVGHPTAFVHTLAGKRIPAEWYIQPGPVGLILCHEFGITGLRPRFGLYPKGVLALDLYRREGAFRLALPIAQLWRIRAGGRTGELDKAWVPRNLFEMAGVSLPTDRRLSARWLDRRCEDLEALVECRLLHSWEWKPEWAADLAIGGNGTRRGWGWLDRLLDQGRLILEPHPTILRQYADAGLLEGSRFLDELTARPGVETPTRALPGPTRTPRRLQRRQQNRMTN
jgi:hypothetical protein